MLEKNDLNYENFFIDKELNFRIVYPYRSFNKIKIDQICLQIN